MRSRSRRYHSSSAARHTGQCHGYRTADNSPHHASSRGYTDSPDIPFPSETSFVLARWTHRIGSGSNRNASSIPAANSTSRCRIPPRDRPDFGLRHRIRRSAPQRRAGASDATTPRQVHVAARRRLGGRLGDGVRQPRHRWLHSAHIHRLCSSRTLTENIIFV